MASERPAAVVVGGTMLAAAVDSILCGRDRHGVLLGLDTSAGVVLRGLDERGGPGSVDEAAVAAAEAASAEAGALRVVGWYSARADSAVCPTVREAAVHARLSRARPDLLFCVLSAETSAGGAVHSVDYAAFRGVPPRPVELRVANATRGSDDEYAAFRAGALSASGDELAARLAGGPCEVRGEAAVGRAVDAIEALARDAAAAAAEAGREAERGRALLEELASATARQQTKGA